MQLEHQSDEFNRASATTISEQTLLNAVRASLDLPLSFTKLQKYTTGNMANGSFTPKLPFGGDALRVFDFGPTVTLSSGVSAIEYVDVNNSSALGKLNGNLQYDTIDRYFYQGVDSRVLDTLFIEYVEIHADLMTAIKEKYHKRCSKPNVDDRPRCREQEEIRVSCEAAISQEDVYRVGSYQIVAINNRASSKCEFLAFQFFRNLLRFSEYWSDLVIESGVEKVKNEEGKIVAVPREKSRQGVRFDDPDIQMRYTRLATLLKQGKGKKEKERQPLLFVLRSPKSLLTYLGELIALQNFASVAYVPEVFTANGKKAALLRVIRGKPMGEPIALSVRGPDEQVYTVPRPDYGIPNRDQTLRVLGMVGEVVNGAISEKDFPAPASVVVRSIQ
jgi:hypothetical protein